MSRPSFTIELALDARFAKDLAAGGVFVPARGFRVLDEIDLVVRGLAGELCVLARVVYIDPANGCGLELVGFGPEMKEQLAQIAVTPAEVAAVAGTKQRRKRVLTNSAKRKTRDSIEMIALECEGADPDGDDAIDEDEGPGDDGDEIIVDEDDLGDTASIVVGRTPADDADQHIASGRPAGDADQRIASKRTPADDADQRIASGRPADDADQRMASGRPADDENEDTLSIADGSDDADPRIASELAHDADQRTASIGAGPPTADDLATGTDENGEDDVAVARTKSGRIALNSIERLRGLSLADQIKVARGPSASERMAVERMYGKNVWDALLHNPGLTTPEVARLARLGTLPRPLLELIVGNSTWLQVPEVRRALLANPRLGTDQIARVLRLLPKHELKVASTVPAYPQSVRSLAKKLIKDSD
ncbi:MAG: hypothetical protein AB7T06_00145 [Kofleriaceae bacterium]